GEKALQLARPVRPGVGAGSVEVRGVPDAGRAERRVEGLVHAPDRGLDGVGEGKGRVERARLSGTACQEEAGAGEVRGQIGGIVVPPDDLLGCGVAPRAVTRRPAAGKVAQVPDEVRRAGEAREVGVDRTRELAGRAEAAG